MVTKTVIATAIMLAGIVAGFRYARWLPSGVLLIIVSAVTTLVAGFGVPVPMLVEGMFTYLNIVLICATGAVFLKTLEDSGAAAAMTRSMVRRFYQHPSLLIALMMVLLLIPGMLTGIAVNAILSAGVLVAPIMIAMGIPRVTTAVIIGIGSILSMTVPPANLLAMTLAMGINAPFEGFDVPTLVISVPLAIISGLLLAWPYLRGRRFDLEELLAALPGEKRDATLKTWIPLGSVLLILAAVRVFPRWIPDVGSPLAFAIGTLLATLTHRNFSVVKSIRDALSGPMLAILELLVGVGVLVEAASLTGVRGLLVASSLSLPRLAAYLAAAVSLYIVGGTLSPFGAASIFGVPFVLFFLDKNQIITIVGISLLAALSQFTPPTAVAGRFAAQVAGVTDYSAVWRASLVPIAILASISLLIIAFADQIARVLL